MKNQNLTYSALDNQIYQKKESTNMYTLYKYKIVRVPDETEITIEEIPIECRETEKTFIVTDQKIKDELFIRRISKSDIEKVQKAHYSDTVYEIIMFTRDPSYAIDKIISVIKDKNEKLSEQLADNNRFIDRLQKTKANM